MAIEAGEPEQMPFLLIIDGVATEVDDAETLPLAQAVEAIKQALAPIEGIEVHMAHFSIREHREEILSAFEAISDEEARRGQ